MKLFDKTWKLALSGVVIGLLVMLLAMSGNPANMAICVACFIRDAAGALKLHTAAPVQYFRPEIVGFVCGSFLISMATKEYRSTAGSAPMVRFLLGAVMMIGALVFLGCPLRMVLRMSAGDLNAYVALIGFAGGVATGSCFLKKGFSLGRAYETKSLSGAVLPVLLAALLVIGVATGAYAASTEGPGSKHAPIAVALIVGLIVGALAQRSRLCTVGGLRDAMMFKDFKLLYGFIAVIIAVIIGNLITGNFNLGFEGQPVAHTDGLWNALGMALVGWGSVLLGGCPLRQLVLAGEGSADSTITVLGMMVGAALCHNFGLASSANGPTQNGMIAVVIGFVVVAIVSFRNVAKEA